MSEPGVPRTIPQPPPMPLEPAAIVATFARRMMYQLGRDEYNATDFDAFQALAFSVRDRLMDRFFATQRTYYNHDAKRVYYLSLEYLLGRLLMSNMLNLGAAAEHSEAMSSLGFTMDQLASEEHDAGLGNGGLGRLAACFLDSAATLSLPFFGYGIRYEFGIFRQKILDGEQTEMADPWLRLGNPWEIPRPDVLFQVKFYGRTERYNDETGRTRVRWEDAQRVHAMAYDVLVPGYRNHTVNSLRLWAAKSTREFDLTRFNAGEYVAAVEDKYAAENISKVLYPPDDQYAGRELRLKQQYFFTSATIQDVIRRFKKRVGRRQEDMNRFKGWEDLPAKVAIQLNDTHPAIAIPELMRVLVDEESLEWDDAWWICERVFGYTNHTVLPEALESWNRDLFEKLLPRHMEIIEEIDRRLRQSVSVAYPGDDVRVRSMAVIEHGNVRMANLAIVGSHAVNGVAKLHTDILKTSTFRHFHELYPTRFTSKTNGVTHRRWLLQANPELSALINEVIGDRWILDPEALGDVEPFMEDAEFRVRWQRVQFARNLALANWLKRTHAIVVEPEWLFDVQIKRIHEYKRQLLNVLHVLSLYQRLLDGDTQQPARAVIFGGKAAPSYRIAKLIIALIHSVAAKVAAVPRVAQRLSVSFVPDYGVTAAEMLFPGTDLSEQISTAGTEASGTGCMKAALNGAVIIGTLDGANIEILERVGRENMFVFGHTSTEINDLRQGGYNAIEWVDRSPDLRAVIELVAGMDDGKYRELVDLLLHNDRYFHCADFDSYVETHKRAASTWIDRDRWTRMSIINTARSGPFSADRTVADYAREIWDVQPVKVPPPTG